MINEQKSAVQRAVFSETRLYTLMPSENALMNGFVIRTRGGKLIVIDGGCDGPDNLHAPAYLPSALRAIMGVGENGYIEVEAWILSHAHKDHFYELAKTLNECAHDKGFVVKQFIFDFPNFGTEEYPTPNEDQAYLDVLKTALMHYAELRNIPVREGSSYYDDLNGAFANAESIKAGCELIIDGVRLEFMQTWSVGDIIVNNNSLIVRAWVDGQSILFLQDTYIHRGVTLLERYGSDLKSDIVQMAHHGQNGVSQEVYDVVNASVHIWPTPSWVWNDMVNHCVYKARMWVNGGVDFTEANEYNIVTCQYPAYPSVRNSVAAWEEVIDNMYISLPYKPKNKK